MSVFAIRRNAARPIPPRPRDPPPGADLPPRFLPAPIIRQKRTRQGPGSRTTPGSTPRTSVRRQRGSLSPPDYNEEEKRQEGEGDPWRRKSTMSSSSGEGPRGSPPPGSAGGSSCGPPFLKGTGGGASSC